MRISKRVIGPVLALVIAAPAIAFAATEVFKSPDDAFKQGMGAYTGGYYEIAIPALEAAAANNVFLAQFYLARIYADNQSANTDHARAYLLYLKIANEYADVDPDDDVRAPYVSKALTALAGYVRRGLPEVGLEAEPERAAEYLHHAAIYFNEEDAQFELAKMQLKGEGVPADEARAKHWLSVLSQKGHAGAQAFLADLYWHGTYMERDVVRALALISIAVKNAPASERLWIEDIYQNIFCGSADGIRKQATGVVANWNDRYIRPPVVRDRSGLGDLNVRPVRACENGEQVPLETLDLPAGVKTPPVGAEQPDLPDSGARLRGSSSAGALRDIGTTASPPPVR